MGTGGTGRVWPHREPFDAFGSLQGLRESEHYLGQVLLAEGKKKKTYRKRVARTAAVAEGM